MTRSIPDPREFELIDGTLFLSLGTFATYREAVEFAHVHQIAAYELWEGDELIEDVRAPYRFATA